MGVYLRYIRPLLNISLIFAIATASCIDDNDSRTTVDYRLPNNTVPMHYSIKLTPHIDDENFTYDGESRVKIKIRFATRIISLHTLKLEIDETATTLTNEDNAIYKPTMHKYNNNTQILALHFDHEFSAGTYTLNMKFIGSSNTSQGFYRLRDEIANASLAVTHLEATAARTVFPCWDEPALKATFDISVKHYRKYKVLSNMPRWEQLLTANGMLWTLFETTPIMSTYLVAVVVFEIDSFVRLRTANEAINVWCRPHITSQIQFALSVVEKSALYMAHYTNISVKVPKTDHFAVPYYHPTSQAMENWGLIFYKEQHFLYTNSNIVALKRNVAHIVAHEMAHQWFGNLVTPSWWSYLWLSKGIASLFQAYIVHHIFEDWRTHDFLRVETLQSSLFLDTGEWPSTVVKVSNASEIKAMFSSLVYDKSTSVLYMLQHVITKDVMDKGFTKYLRKHQFSSATSDDLWSAMQTALDESNVPYSSFKIKEVMDAWMNNKSYPVVTVTRNYETGGITIKQKCFRPQKNNETNNVIPCTKWWIPITFTTQSQLNFSNTNILSYHWLTPEHKCLYFLDRDLSIPDNKYDINDWFIVNLQQIGYYRVNYDHTNWRRISNYLNSEEYTNIHVLNRAQIIDDAYAFVKNKQLNVSVFMNLVWYLSRDMDFMPWYSMFRILSDMSQYFPLQESKTIQSYMSEIFNNPLENIGYEKIPNEDDLTQLKRLNMTNWACIVGNSECKRMANVKLVEHLADPERHKLLPWWEEWTYCAGLMAANQTTWDAVMALYMHTKKQALLEYLTCSENSTIIILYLYASASNKSLANKRDFIFMNILEKHARNDAVLDYILEISAVIKPKSVSIVDYLSRIINYLYSREQLDKINNFVYNYYIPDSPQISLLRGKVEERFNIVKSMKAAFSFKV